VTINGYSVIGALQAACLDPGDCVVLAFADRVSFSFRCFTENIEIFASFFSFFRPFSTAVFSFFGAFPPSRHIPGSPPFSPTICRAQLIFENTLCFVGSGLGSELGLTPFERDLAQIALSIQYEDEFLHRSVALFYPKPLAFLYSPHRRSVSLLPAFLFSF